MLYLENLGKWLIVGAILLFIFSIIPSLWSITKKTEHDEKSCEYIAKTMQGYSIAGIAIGLLLVLLPYIAGILLAILVLVIKLIFVIITLPFQIIL